MEVSERVQKCIEGINILNAEHNADIRGGLVSLFYGDKFTKEEIRYIEQNIRPQDINKSINLN